jgi:error-prone DNA polymerase
VDVSHSDWDSTLEGSALRLGLRLITGLGEAPARTLVTARAVAPFRSVRDVGRRTTLGRPLLARLAAADAFASLGVDRRAALWQVLLAGDEMPLFDGLEDDGAPPDLPPLALRDEVVADYDSVGLSLRAHPMSLLRTPLAAAGIITAAGLARVADKAVVKVAGLVVVRQQPMTAKGTVFVTLEDETGGLNLVVWKTVWARYRAVARDAVALLVEGRLQRGPGGVTHVIANRIEDLSRFLYRLTTRSRDFQ